MPRCKFCSRKSIFLRVDSNGLCDDCASFVPIDISYRIRIVNDSIRLISNSSNLKTRLSRCIVAEEHLIALVKYEQLGIKFPDPPPSSLLQTVIALRAEIKGHQERDINQRSHNPSDSVEKMAYDTGQPPQNMPVLTPSTKTTVVPDNMLSDFVGGDNWELSISFGKSSSPNYQRALFLAKTAPKYIKSVDDDGNTIHQALYGAKADEFLAACQLYELVENWKSSAVFVNGKPVDRKIFGQVKYCYGDRCRSGKADYCYGASVLTKNPFGCHRAMIHATNDPWWSFTERCADGYYYLRKEQLASELINRLRRVYICPALDIKSILAAANNLPNRLSEQEIDKLNPFKPVTITVRLEPL